MTRKEKINLLQAIKTGKATISSIQPLQIYMFEKSNTNVECFRMNGKEYDAKQYKDLRNKIKHENCLVFIWDELKEYEL